ncbi:MAG: hypothetical protein EBV15_02830 [Bacteroidetes bacterium]|nr:hypothetical protein [Bacteroidota bacterium]
MNYQLSFIQIIKNTVPPNMHLAEEVSSALGISADSAYRRLRGETDFTLNETVKLCKHFSIPLEALNAEMEDVVSFRINNILGNDNSFQQYLLSLDRDLTWLARFDDSMLYYAAEDLPVFYHFFFPRLARFKMIYWTKSILNVPAFQGVRVEEVQVPDGWSEVLTDITRKYQSIPTTEIWNEDTIKSTIQQIRFYWEAGFFKDPATLLDILEDLTGVIEMASRQAETGKKYNPAKGTFNDTPFSMYISDLMIGNNHVFMSSGTRTSSYIGYGSFNYMRTANAVFNGQISGWLENLIAKSTLVSKVAEKQRNQFFKQALKRVVELKEEIAAG